MRGLPLDKRVCGVCVKMNIYDLVRKNDVEGIRSHAWTEPQLNRQTEEGLTPLMLAAKLGYNKVVHTLKEKGADTDIRDGDGRKAVHHAALNGHGLIIMLLIESGCGA